MDSRLWPGARTGPCGDIRRGHWHLLGLVDLVLIIQERSLHNHAADLVRIHVRRRPAILVVSAVVVGNLCPNPDAGTAVAHAVREAVDRGGVVLATHPPL